MILNDDLVGVYLHRSAATGCFNPDRSDIDLLCDGPPGTVARTAPRRRHVAAGFPIRRPLPGGADRGDHGAASPAATPDPFEFHYRETRRASLAQQLAAGALAKP